MKPVKNHPSVGSKWRDKDDGDEYMILAHSNIGLNEIHNPVNVIYQHVLSGKILSKLLNTWHTSMEVVEPNSIYPLVDLEVEKPVFATLDDWIRDYEHTSVGSLMVGWFLLCCRMPDALKEVYKDFMPQNQHKAWCTYDGSRYRIVGCSKAGDVYITRIKSGEVYEESVNVNHLSKFDIKK